jgi:Na+-driven multidrug efflux pump
MAMEFAVGGALRGAGDTFFPMVSVFVGLFLVRLVPATCLVLFADVPVQWIWCALIADYLTKAMLLTARFRRGTWRTIEV